MDKKLNVIAVKNKVSGTVQPLWYLEDVKGRKLITHKLLKNVELLESNAKRNGVKYDVVILLNNKEISFDEISRLLK